MFQSGLQVYAYVALVTVVGGLKEEREGPQENDSCESSLLLFVTRSHWIATHRTQDIYQLD